MYSQNRFYVTSVGLINCEQATLHNKNCIVTLSIVIYTSSKYMLMKIGSAIESSMQYIYIYKMYNIFSEHVKWRVNIMKGILISRQHGHIW